MRLSSISIKQFKRFEDLTISGLGQDVKLVMLTGPNGSGKTSVFEAFNYWISCIKEKYEIDLEYHFRGNSSNFTAYNWQNAWNAIKPEFHGMSPFVLNTSFRTNPKETQKAFYIRSAYRHEADFTTHGLSKASDVLLNTNSPLRLILAESRVSENYQRLAAESFDTLYDIQHRKKTCEEVTEAVIGEIRTAMRTVFDDLILDGPTNPMTGGTFRFTKGTTSGFHYKNLSGGEKAAFDLLVDFIIKKRAFDDTIFCIDEPELHMHTRLQANLLRQLYALVPEKCQLWISTHSIGMARMASELEATSPGSVAFLDFHDFDFDAPVRITPSKPDRRYWKRMFSTALDDLAELVTPKNVVLCEGKQLGAKGRKPSFDVSVYRVIFRFESADLEFLPAGGHSEVESSSSKLTALMTAIAPGIRIWAVFDRDDRSQVEIENLQATGIHVLSRRDLESYLWDDEIIRELCNNLNVPERAAEIIEAKKRFLAESAKRGNSDDDIKAIAPTLYTYTRDLLRADLHKGFGNDSEAFAIATLAPLFKPTLDAYKELKSVVLAPLLTLPKG